MSFSELKKATIKFEKKKERKNKPSNQLKNISLNWFFFQKPKKVQQTSEIILKLLSQITLSLPTSYGR